jgi:hypothetical protein
MGLRELAMSQQNVNVVRGAIDDWNRRDWKEVRRSSS